MYLPEIAASYRRPPNPTQGLVVGIEALADQLRFHFQRLTAEQVRTALVYWYQHEAEIQDELDEEDIAAIHARRRYSNLT